LCKIRLKTNNFRLLKYLKAKQIRDQIERRKPLYKDIADLDVQSETSNIMSVFRIVLLGCVLGACTVTALDVAVRGACVTKYGTFELAVGKALEYLDRHNIICAEADGFLVSWKLETTVMRSSFKRVSWKCCKIDIV
ncbi:unnamed protein product, partial [Owenia fusiformis]